MRTILAFVFLCSACFAEDRIRVVLPLPEEEAVDGLVKMISSACSRRSFREYMDCFTPERAKLIRRSVENMFICGDAEMEIVDSFLISADDDSIEFGLRYVMMEPSSPTRIFCSKVVAKKVGDSWKIDSEEIRSVKNREEPPRTIAAREPVRPAVNNQPAGWRFPNPANGGEEAWLPKDIGYRPGPSCANGQCRVRAK